jgi:hypothetical protein
LRAFLNVGPGGMRDNHDERQQRQEGAQSSGKHRLSLTSVAARARQRAPLPLR